MNSFTCIYQEFSSDFFNFRNTFYLKTLLGLLFSRHKHQWLHWYIALLTLMPYCLATFQEAQQFGLCLSPKKQICILYAIFDCVHAQRFYLTAWRLEFVESRYALVNERSTFYYEVFKYYLNMLKIPHSSSIAGAKGFSIKNFLITFQIYPS